jgi:Pro-kumamolisin, activation domain/ell wall binding domain 2 (CWB2)
MRPIVVNEVADSGAPHRLIGGFVRRSHRAGIAVATACGLLLTLAINVSGIASAGTGDTPVGSAPAIPLGAQAQGAAPAAQPVSFDVVLRPRNQAALDAFTTAVSTPGSPQYRQFMTPAEYASQFGPTPATISAVTSRLQSLGLTVGTAQGSLLPVSGSVTKVGSALHTSFRQYRLTSGRTARANVAAPQVPSDVVGAVQAIVGLDTLTQLTHALPTISAPSQDIVRSNSPAPALNANLSGPTACGAAAGPPGYTASQLASYYGLTSLYSGGTLGSGVTVAIAELEPFTPSDIASYQTCYGTAAQVTPVSVDGGPSGGQSGEAALDIEDVIGLAPAATIDVYQAPNSLTSVLHMYQQIATDNVAQVVSTSWGQCEARDTGSFLNSENTIFQQMAAQGQTMVAASGDAGSADCDNPIGGTGSTTTLAVDDPASQPFVTGVGGTNLQTTSGPESTWNEGTVNGSLSAGGGGISIKWPMPSWQTAIGVITGSSGTPCGVSAGSFCREVPDVSASAQPSNGYRIYVAGAWHTFGGTSAAAPTWAALIALADASSACNGHRLGFLNPALYQLRAAWPADFHDVTAGNNDAVGTNGGSFAAAGGYDMASGLGTPVGANLSGDLCSDGSGTIVVDQTTINASTHTTLHFTYTAAAGHNLTAGELTIAVPAGWSPPSTTVGQPGYTTSPAGTVTISSSTIQLSGLTVASGSTVTITYGDTAGGGPGALSPSTAQTSSFTTSLKGLSTSTLTALASSPQVLVGGPDGSGTLSVSPSSIAPSTLTALNFTYTAQANTSLVAGSVAITVPVGGSTGWTPPNTTPSTAGYVTASAGTVTVAGSTIRVDGVSLPGGGSMTITYGAGSGGATTSPSAVTTTSFSAQERNTSSGTLASLATSPSVAVGTGGGGGGGGSGGAGSAARALTLARIAGADRIATSVAASQAGFPTTHSAAAVVLARSDTFADALAGTPLAVDKHGPLLLTASASLSTATAAEIQRVLAPGAAVYVLGGTSAVTPAVANAVAALGHPVVRVSGADRFATAAQVAATIGSPSIVFEADGTNFPDALSAGSAAAEAGGVVLLTDGSGQSGPTAAYLAAHPSAKRYAIGGPAAHADASATAFVGSDRFATSVLVAQAFFPKPAAIGLASGLAFPDALSGGSVAAMKNGPIVLVPSGGALPDSVASYLETAQTSATSAWLFGGTVSVGADIFNAAAAILGPTA